MPKIGQWFDRWVDDFRIPPEGLALFRICFAGAYLLFRVPQFIWVGQFPPGFYNPPPMSPAVLLGSFPPDLVLWSLSLGICLLLIALMFGYRTRTVSILLAVLWIFGDNLNYSFGKIDHGLTPRLVPLVMAFSSWGSCYSIDAHRRSKHVSIKEHGPWTPAAVACLLGASFLTAGYPKFLRWIDFDLSTQGVRRWLFDVFYIDGRQEYLVSFYIDIQNRFFWEMLDIAAVMFEMGFFVALLWPPLFRAFVFAAVFFHINNYLMLNIPFTGLMWVYGLFIAWDRIARKISGSTLAEWLQDVAKPKYMILFACGYVPLYLTSILLADPLLNSSHSPLSLFLEQLAGLDYSMIMTWSIYAIAVTVALLHLYWAVSDRPKTRRTVSDATIVSSTEE